MWTDVREFVLKVVTLVTGALLTYFVVTRDHERFKSGEAFALEFAKQKVKFLADIVGKIEVYHRAVDWVSIGAMTETEKVLKQQAALGRVLPPADVLRGIAHGCGIL